MQEPKNDLFTDLATAMNDLRESIRDAQTTIDYYLCAKHQKFKENHNGELLCPTCTQCHWCRHTKPLFNHNGYMMCVDCIQAEKVLP